MLKLTTFATALVLFAVPASAMPGAGTGVAGQTNAGLPVLKVHGYHPDCRQGPARYHRHTRGGANVACIIERPRHRPISRCHAWVRECAERWGRRSPGFHRCVARHGC
ncbi:MAG: hypothetical protein R3D68_13980 [Hyphomicrobiaceae bacterium]